MKRGESTVETLVTMTDSETSIPSDSGPESTGEKHSTTTLGNPSGLAARRPLKTRQWPFFQSLSTTLARSGVTPNSISVSSIFAGIAAGISMSATACVPEGMTRRFFWIAAAVCIQLRLIANLLDGMVAIEGGKASAVGDLYNEVPDRISDTAIFTGAGFAVGGNLTLGLTASLVAMFVAYTRAIGASVGVGQVFRGPFAKPQRMALMTAACLAAAALPSGSDPFDQHSGIGLIGVTLMVIVVGGILTAILRLQDIAAKLRCRTGERE